MQRLRELGIARRAQSWHAGPHLWHSTPYSEALSLVAVRCLPGSAAKTGTDPPTHYLYRFLDMTWMAISALRICTKLRNKLPTLVVDTIPDLKQHLTDSSCQCTAMQCIRNRTYPVPHTRLSWYVARLPLSRTYCLGFMGIFADLQDRSIEAA